jgi:hypothetical protein
MDAAEVDQITACLSSLDASETNVQSLLDFTDAQEQVHGPRIDQLISLITAFSDTGNVTLRKRAERLSQCCKWPLVLVKKNGKPAMSLQRCRDRLCPTCSHIKGQQTANKIKDLVQHMNSVRFLTLTLCSTGRTLAELVKRIIDCFRELRRSKAWRQHVTAGIWTIEIKPGKKENTWNVHLHMLIDGSYWSQAAISDAWLAVTGDSSIVDIRKINSVKGAAWYVAKYVAKPGDFTQFSADEILNYAVSVKSRRLFGTFGKLHSREPLDQEENEGEKLTGHAISGNRIKQMASSGSTQAQRAIELLNCCGGYWSNAIGENHPKPEKPVSEQTWLELGQLILLLVNEHAAAAVGGLPPHATCSISQDGATQVVQPSLIDVSPDNAYR